MSDNMMPCLICYGMFDLHNLRDGICIDCATMACDTLNAQLTTLTAERDGLLADKARLDWLDSLPDDTEFIPSRFASNIRAAIDAARQAQEETRV